jgi:hypothetical protein
MRILIISLLVGLGAVGCGSDDTAASGGDMSAVSKDMMTHDLSLAMCGDLGTKHFGETCSGDCDCDTGMCRQFQMGATHLCTKPCTTATQTADCPNPPSTGMCTPNLYCKF